ENPKLAAQLFRELVPHGYRRVAVEVSPPMASALDAALRNDGPAFDWLLTDAESRVPFFGMREEAQWLLDARATAPAGHALPVGPGLCRPRRSVPDRAAPASPEAKGRVGRTRRASSCIERLLGALRRNP